jgi:hypothetical protein
VIDRVAGSAHHLEHRGVGFGTVDEQIHSIADDQRLADQVRAHGQVLVEHRIRRGGDHPLRSFGRPGIRPRPVGTLDADRIERFGKRQLARQPKRGQAGAPAEEGGSRHRREDGDAHHLNPSVLGRHRRRIRSIRT